MKWRLGLCALLALGCKREPERAAPTEASAAPVVVAPSGVPAAKPVIATVDPLTRARAVVSAWDAALNRHDAPALVPLYAASVSFYGRTTPREDLIRAKQKALARTPDYTQSISNLTLSNEADGAVKVSFTKRSGARNAQRDVDASLRLLPSGDGFLIDSESDAPTDARSDNDKNCMEVALDAAYSLPEVVRFFKEAPADARPGGVTFTEEQNRGSAALGFHHDDRFEAVFSIEVDAGRLNVSQYGDVVPVPNGLQSRVRAKCSLQAAPRR